MMRTFVKRYFIDEDFRKQLTDLGFVENERNGVWEIQSEHKYYSVRIIPKENMYNCTPECVRSYEVMFENNNRKVCTNFHFSILKAIADLPSDPHIQVKNNFWIGFDDGEHIEVDCDSVSQYIKDQCLDEFSKYVNDNNDYNWLYKNDFDLRHAIDHAEHSHDKSMIQDIMDFCYDKLVVDKDEMLKGYIEDYFDVKLTDGTYWVESQAGEAYIYE